MHGSYGDRLCWRLISLFHDVLVCIVIEWHQQWQHQQHPQQQQHQQHPQQHQQHLQQQQQSNTIMLILNNQESGPKYWVTRSSCLFAPHCFIRALRCTHSFGCLLALSWAWGSVNYLELTQSTVTVVQNSQESKCEYWAFACPFARSLAPLTHLFASLYSFARVLGGAHLFACSFTHSRAHVKVNNKMFKNDLVFSHRVCNKLAHTYITYTRLRIGYNDEFVCTQNWKLFSFSRHSNFFSSM